MTVVLALTSQLKCFSRRLPSGVVKPPPKVLLSQNLLEFFTRLLLPIKYATLLCHSCLIHCFPNKSSFLQEPLTSSCLKCDVGVGASFNDTPCHWLMESHPFRCLPRKGRFLSGPPFSPFFQCRSHHWVRVWSSHFHFSHTSLQAS